MPTFALVGSLRVHYITKMIFLIVLSSIRLAKFELPLRLIVSSLFARQFPLDMQNSTDFALLGHFWEIRVNFSYSKLVVLYFTHFIHFQGTFIIHARLLF